MRKLILNRWEEKNTKSASFFIAEGKKLVKSVYVISDIEIFIFFFFYSKQLKGKKTKNSVR